MEIGSYEAKTHLPKLLARVAKGERITITKRGKVIAELVPPGGVNLDARRKLIDDLHQLGETMRARGVRITREEIVAWKNEGRR
ncbi:MAG: type II toxin-antitoxin system prevent-host-death family antitoxin [Stagnimonas sp.]|nr:type II toxin-antitoxin system prevent-host-death family antitoxin [Stagnimonas sp.]